MQHARTILCKHVFDLSSPAKFATGLVLDKPVGFINGTFIPSTGTNITVEDPCTNNVIGEIPDFGAKETSQAIDAAQSAFQSWRRTMPRERAVIIRRWADLMFRHKEALGSILSRESGKALAEGIGETLYAARFLEWYAGEAERVYGDIIPGPRESVRTTVLKEPIGVVGVITPWNFPSAMITRAAGGALAAGCTVVLKPSELTPFSALALAQLSLEAGVPDGVLNIVTGAPQAIGDTMLESFNVRKISFTGSTRVGKYLYEHSAQTMKKLGLELGGNAPFIVFEDADLDKAVKGLIEAKMRNAGQTCISCNRVFVHEKVHDEFVELFVQKMRLIKVGNSFDHSVTMGSLINAAAVTRIEELVKDAIAKGAKLEIGGKRISGKGYFFEPTVLTNVNHDTARCCQEEIFGPLVPVVKFTSEEDVVRLSNSTPAGLASYFYTQDYRRQKRVAEQLRFGMVGVNDTMLSSPCAPFGGIKESGLGRDGSKYGIDAFLDIKYVLESRV